MNNEIINIIESQLMHNNNAEGCITMPFSDMNLIEIFDYFSPGFDVSLSIHMEKMEIPSNWGKGYKEMKQARLKYMVYRHD